MRIHEIELEVITDNPKKPDNYDCYFFYHDTQKILYCFVPEELSTDLYNYAVASAISSIKGTPLGVFGEYTVSRQDAQSIDEVVEKVGLISPLEVKLSSLYVPRIKEMGLKRFNNWVEKFLYEE